jgi:hypothetical protein
MKKITKNLLPILGIVGLIFMTSCGKDEGVVATAPSISISASVDGSAIASGDDVTVGSSVSFAVTITAPGGVNGLTVGGTSYSRTELGASAGDISGEITLTAGAALETQIGATISFEFVAVDDLNQTTTETFTYVVVALPSPDVITHTQTLIGGQSNTSAGSFYNSVTDAVYTYADMRDNNSANTDFLFFYGNTNLYTIAAINDADASTAFDAAIGPNSLSAATIQTRNATKFKALTTMTAAQFDAIISDNDLLSAYGEVAASATKVNGLAAGNVFAFVLADARGSRTGLVKVIGTNGTDGSSRSIDIQVKIVSE